MKWDVFLSYSKKDKEKVKRIKERMSQEGLKLFIDELSMQPGDALHQKIGEAIQESVVMVQFLSENALSSEWVTFERNCKLYQDPTNKKRCFIPVLLEKCSNLPLLISGYLYIDLTNDYKKGMEIIISSCKRVVEDIQNNKRKMHQSVVTPLSGKNIILETWRNRNEKWFSAPGAIFFAGEHAVVFGHPAVYFPIPLRVHALVKHTTNHNRVKLKATVPDPDSPNKISNINQLNSYNRAVSSEHTDNLNLLFQKVILPCLLPFGKDDKYGFEIEVYSEIPISCGLNASGALSVCIAEALLSNYLNVEKLGNDLQVDSKDRLKLTFYLALLIENCFHNMCASGAGVAASLYGRSGNHPIIYLTEKKSQLKHRLKEGWRPINNRSCINNIKSHSPLRYYIIDPAENRSTSSPYTPSPPFNISVLYSGSPSRTGDILRYQQIREFNNQTAKRVNEIQEEFSNTIGLNNLHNPLSTHAKEYVPNIYLNNELDAYERSEELRLGYFELSCEALGILSVAMMNSVFSDWNAVPRIMNACQDILSFSGLTDPVSERNTLRLRSKYKNHNKDSIIANSPIGAKITGCGNGGSFLVFSFLNNEDHYSMVSDGLSDILPVHFDSSQIDDKNWRTPVQGVRPEQ